MENIYPGYGRELKPGEYVSSEFIKEKVALCTRVLAKGGILPWVFGHCSAKIPGSDKMYIISHVHWSGKLFQEVTPEEVHMVDMQGNALDCESIDIPEERFFHIEVFKARPDIGGLIYGHPNMSCAFAAAGRDTLTLWDEKIPIMDAPGFGSAADRGKKVAEKLGKARAVVWNSSTVVVGKTIEEATVNAFALEWEAQRQYFMVQLGVQNPKPVNYLAPYADRADYATKAGFQFFAAMDPGVGKKVDGELFWKNS